MSDPPKSLSDSIIENDSDLEQNLLNSFEKLSIHTIPQTKMATVPKFDSKELSIVPDFDGNPNKLHRFITASEALLAHYFDINNANNFQNLLLLNGILNKLHGRAEEIVVIHGATNDWLEIKNALILNFSDQRDENSLNQDLVNSIQKWNESPQEFYERILHLLNSICNYIDLRCNAAEKESKRTFFKNQALKSFLAGLRDPLGPIIRAMRPTSLAQAIQFIIEEDNIKHLQKSKNFQIPRKTVNTKQNRINYNPVHNGNPQFQSPQSYGNSQFANSQHFKDNHQHFPSRPVTLQRNFNHIPPRFPTHSQVFKKPHQNYPTPMSISTNNTVPKLKTDYSTQRNFSNRNRNQDFISEELYNSENYDQNNIEFEDYSKEENFQNIQTDNQLR